MKKSTFIAFLSASTFYAGATVRTVSNHVNSPGQYTSVQAACDASATNDTIYVHGSPTNYGDVNVMKPLVLIGSGASPNKNFYYPCTVGNIYVKFNTTNTQSGSGSKIMGFQSSLIYLQTNSAGTLAVSNVTIERNTANGIYFSSPNGGTSPSNGFSGTLIKNNIITAIAGSNLYLNNVLIKNNFIGHIDNFGKLSGSNVVVSNNILGYNIGNSYALTYCYYTNFSNNIFYSPLVNTTFLNTSPYYGIVQNCSFSNNLFLSAATLVPSNIIFGNNSGGGNILNTDPLFVEAGNGSLDYLYSSQFGGSTYYNFNLNLQTGSPCIVAGTDGTDIGIYGGNTPFVEGDTYIGVNGKHQRYFPMPNVPAVLDMHILNTSVLPNGNLNVEFKARKQD